MDSLYLDGELLRLFRPLPSWRLSDIKSENWIWKWNIAVEHKSDLTTLISFARISTSQVYRKNLWPRIWWLHIEIWESSINKNSFFSLQWNCGLYEKKRPEMWKKKQVVSGDFPINWKVHFKAHKVLVLAAISRLFTKPSENV